MDEHEGCVTLRVSLYVESDTPYLGLDHVDPPRAQLPDAVVDVHHALSLRHVQHDVDDDEAASASGPGATGERREEKQEWEQLR